jgi:hypothetical protein
LGDQVPNIFLKESVREVLARHCTWAAGSTNEREREANVIGLKIKE